MNEQDLKQLFETHKTEVSDQGFSKRLIRQLPERKSLLPQLIMVVFIVIGLALTFAIQGFTPWFEQISSLIASISRLQAPSPSAVIAYLGLLSVTGIIAYALAQADAG